MENTIITIGRQFGSGGRLVAEAIGRKLGIHVYDNQLISKAAEESGYSRELFLRSDETRSLFSFSSFFNTGSRFLHSENYMNDNVLFKIQSEVIREIAENESAVIIGRCSDYILRDLDCLDVFITAPLQVRIRRVMEREGVSEGEAGAIVTKKDRTRETYYNYFTLCNWGMASNYDLCIDSSILGIESTAEAIIEFGRRGGTVRI